MKMAVCGKGGSGKSTVAALLAREFQRKGHPVLVIDSDESNSGLHWMLGLEAQPKPLMEFVGGKKHIQNQMAEGFIIDTGETILPVWQQQAISLSDLPSSHKAERNGCTLVVTGKIDHTFEGCACPMGVVVREFLKKLEVRDSQVVIVDLEAGIEHFGRGIESSLDGVIAVVEPSLESLNLSAKIRTMAQAGGVAFWGAILNKVRSEASLPQLYKELDKRGIKSLGHIEYREGLLEGSLLGRPLELEEDIDEVSLLRKGILKAMIEEAANS